MRTDVAFVCERDTRVVRGDIKKSRKPYIEYEGAVYRNEVLARSPDLIGERLTLHVNTDDLRCITAFLPNGAELGVLSAQPPWHRAAHSLETRTAINGMRHKKLLAFTEMDDPMQLYHDHLGREALKKRRGRVRYEKQRRERAAAAATEGSVVNAPAALETPPKALPPVPRKKTVTY